MKTLLERAKDWLNKLGAQMNDVITDCQHLRVDKKRLFVIPVKGVDEFDLIMKMPPDFVLEFCEVGDYIFVTFCEPKTGATLPYFSI